MSVSIFHEQYNHFIVMHQCSRKSFYKTHELKNQWVSMNVYYRKTLKIAKLMNVILTMDDLVKIETNYWKMIGEFETWIITYSTFYDFVWFRNELSNMLSALIQHLILTFPEQKKSFTWIDNYPHVNRGMV